MAVNNKKYFDFFILIVVLSAIGFVYFIAEDIKKTKVEAVKKEKYKLYANNIHSEIDTLIKNKQELTFSIALALSQDNKIINALKTNDVSKVTLKEFSNHLRETTQLENVWFHVIDNKGNSFFRTWVPKRGDSVLNIRLDVAQMIKNPRIITTISTGKFDMTFKSMVPMYDNGNFIGIFEIITHFNSIAKQLEDANLETVVIVDKKYKKQIKKPFTKMFLGDYYIANFSAKEEYLSYLEKQGIENYIHSKSEFLVDYENNHFIVVYNIPDINGNPMGSIITFKSLDSLIMEDIKVIQSNLLTYTSIIILVLLLLGYFLISRKHTNELDHKVKVRTDELESEKQYIQTILDMNPNIIIVTNSFQIIDANKRFLEFFECEKIEDFTKEHDCICDYFITLDDKPFCENKLVEGIPWAEYVAKQKQEHTVQLQYKDVIYVFTVDAEYLKTDGDILLTFQNITELKRKDRLLYEQSKLASMGEMIGNIAHQWRQPLSVVSTGATGMQLQKQVGVLTDEEFNKTCELINKNAQYLSKTIDDFKDFIKGDREKTKFFLKDEFEKLLSLIGPSLKSNNIQCVMEVDSDLEMNGFSNELLQCFMNIFNNSKDVLKDLENSKRLIIINGKKSNGKIEILLKDNGGGIGNDILGKVFEPYFTTKHQKQGTGLGLHMTYNMVVHGMDGNIEVYNENFIFEGKNYSGAVFKITLPS